MPDDLLEPGLAPDGDDTPVDDEREPRDDESGPAGGDLGLTPPD